ncbi:hypothetical protein [Aliarcobacter butzleri]|uniref:hypothetical protein n=1 Tax=Aliarcobacter butzleri TaxID=28197 RepID=UPI00125FF3CA|nr:hypothetical protein [Aliarcobacter butzleri]
MNNYINSRIQAHNNLKIWNAIKHNLRYVQRSLSQLENNNFNYIFLDGKATKITKENKKELYTKISSEYKKDRSEHNEIYKKHNKRNLRESCGSWGEGVFTFSEQLKEDLKNKKYSLNDLSKIALECLKDMEEHLGIKTKYMVLHLDEKTPHFQYFFTNFDNMGASITFKNRETKDLSPLQDIAYKHFGKLGMERGIKKDFTNSNYISAAKYWKTLGIDLKNKTISLEAQYNNKKQEVEKSLKALYTEVNLQKNEVKDLRSNYDRTTQEYKNLTIVFKQLQDEEKTLREKVRELKEIDNLDNYLKLLKNDIKNILEKNTKQVNSFVGSSRIEIENITQMYKELVSKISEPLHSKVKEIEEKDKIIKELNDKLDKKENRINELIVEKNKLNDTNSVLNQENTQIKQKLTLDIQNLEKEQKSFLGTLKQQNQKLRDRTKYLKKILKNQNIKITRDQIRLALNKPKPKSKKIEQSLIRKQELNNLSRI